MTATTTPAVVPDLLRRRAGEDGPAVAVMVDGGEGLCYADWEERSNAVARGLAGLGVEVGGRVALLFDNARWTDYAVAYLAVQKAGGAAVPLSPRFAGPELAHILDHCGASGVVGPPDLLATLEAPGWRAGVAELEKDNGTEAYQVPVGPGALAEILYTSGTTGFPKGVGCSHENLLFHDLLPDGDGAAQPATISFLHAFPVGTNAGQEVLRIPLRRTGRTAIALATFDPDRLCAAVAAHGVNRLQLVPAMAQMLVDSGAAARHDVSSVERITLSSAPAAPALLQRLAQAFPNASLWNAYALTESGTARTLLEHAERRPGSVGRPVGGTEVQVVDQAGRPVPANETGEIWLRRPGAPRREYYRDPEATAAAFVGDWLRTGDLGYLDEEGYLYLVDRSKDLIISGGVNISSLEIENVLYEHPAVVEAAVVGTPHTVLGQDVAAVVAVRSATTPRELQSFVRQRLAEHKTPRRVVFVDRLPRNASGKVLKRELLATLGQAEGAPAGVDARTPVEETVVAIWEEVLGRRPVGVHDDFFELGGHSLAAAQVAARLEEAFAVPVPVTIAFTHPTVAELAAAVEDLRRPGA